MNRATKLLDHTMIVLAVTFGVGWLGLLAATDSLTFIRLNFSEAGVLFWDAVLSFAFFLQHSGMVRRPFRARLATVIAPRYQGAVYAIASGIVLTLVVVLWQRSQTHLLVLHGSLLWIARACSFLAVMIFAWSARALRSFDPLGLGPIRAHLGGRPERPSSFVVRGPYRWVRHPLYSCVIVLIWSNPAPTADRLLFNVLWTAWIWVGAVLEETDLVIDLGDSYRDYRRKVPMLIPWRGPVALHMSGRYCHSLP
jgi:protein-S-isoprenylcysteine O-methyltransferase Ste14